MATDPTIDELDLSGKTEFGLEEANVLALNNRLSYLDLSHTSIGLDINVIKLISQHNTIVTLVLRRSCITPKGVAVLAQNTTVTNLSLDENTIGTEGCKALSQNTT